MSDVAEFFFLPRLLSALFGKGKTFSWKADKAGTISYVCTVHPNMTAKLTVTG